MTLDATRNRWDVISGLGLMALLGIAVALIAHAASAAPPRSEFARNATAIEFTLGALVVMLGFTLALMLWHEWTLRRATCAGATIMPLAESQPDPALALHPGEKLTLWREMRPAPYRRRLAGAVAWSAAGLVSGLAMSALFDWLVYHRPAPWPSQTDALSLLTWALIWTPAALMVISAEQIVTFAMAVRRQDVTVDDTGVTVTPSWGRARFLPWDDIKLVARQGAESAHGNTYWLRGRRRGVALTLGAMSANPRPTDRLRESDFTFGASGGDGRETHPDAIQRLLATVTVRAHVPIRIWEVLYFLSPPKGARQSKRPTLQEALALPLADAPLRPSPADVERARTFTGKRLMLRDRIPFRALAPEIRTTVVIVAMLYLAIAILVPLLTTGRAEFTVQSIGRDFLFCVFVAALATVIGVRLTAVTYRDQTSPTVSAERKRLALLKFNERSRVSIPWPEIRAWALLTPEPGETEPAGCVVWSADDLLMEWRERPDAALAGAGVQGDRRAAYRERARQMHALIAERTGLAPRVIPLAAPLEA